MSMIRLVSACALLIASAGVMTWVSYESAPAQATPTQINYPSALACVETSNLRCCGFSISLG